MKSLFRFLNRRLKGNKKGQSLVEMAVAAPILMLMFIGVFEVGWALRGFLVLANANRETARFAVKNGVLDFSIKDPETVGYEEVLTHSLSSVAKQLPLEFGDPDPNATVIMSHLVVDTGFPCVQYSGGKPVLPYQFDLTNCDCTNGNLLGDLDGDGTPWFSRDDLVLDPDTPSYSYYSRTFGITRTTRLGGGSYQAEAEKLRLENNQLNCTILKTGSTGEVSANNVFVAETFYDQPQLLGVPLVSNPLTDPIPLYSQTAMRIVISREADTTTDSIGPVCELYPLTFSKQLFTDLGQNPDTPITNTVISLYENGPVTYPHDHLGWVVWNPGGVGDNDYLREALENPRLSINDFTDALNGDNILSTNETDRVSPTGDLSNAAQDNDRVAALLNRTIRVPVYDNTPGQVDHIALLTVNSVVPSPSGSREIQATFLKYEDQACEE